MAGVEQKYDMTRWKTLPIWTGGLAASWEFDGLQAETSVPVHPRDMQDYYGLASMYRRELFARAVCLQGEKYQEVISKQDELKFHFYYTGVAPEDGSDVPREWLCLVIYEKMYLPGILRGLRQIGVDLEDADEDRIEPDAEELAFQMMMRATDAWITLNDPWMKSVEDDLEGKLEAGQVHRYQSELGLASTTPSSAQR
mmetsp:Transcript_152584/g.489311  ORF Transcript_152584/g.489311 Transcript_152584/m.489311 type:complete len:198 (+) Transcript_152584:90-683(+)